MQCENVYRPERPSRSARWMVGVLGFLARFSVSWEFFLSFSLSFDHSWLRMVGSHQTKQMVMLFLPSLYLSFLIAVLDEEEEEGHPKTPMVSKALTYILTHTHTTHACPYRVWNGMNWKEGICYIYALSSTEVVHSERERVTDKLDYVRPRYSMGRQNGRGPVWSWSYMHSHFFFLFFSHPLCSAKSICQIEILLGPRHMWAMSSIK